MGLFSSCVRTSQLRQTNVFCYHNYHKTKESCEDRGHAPRRVPRVGMEVGYAQTQLLVGSKPPVGGDHVDGRRLERELPRENELAVVVAPFVGAVLGPAHHVMPANYVITTTSLQPCALTIPGCLMVEVLL